MADNTHEKSNHLNQKALIMLLAFALILGAAIGGTVAYLMDSTEPIVNTFTYGDIDITLTETDTGKDDDDDPNTNEYEMMPGETIKKDPLVTVKQGSKDNWLFVRLEKSGNFDTFMTYEMAAGWEQLLDADGKEIEGVFYRKVGESDAETDDKTFEVILNNQIKVKDEVTKEQLNALEDSTPPAYPTLNVTAYAVQRNAELEAIDSALDAWKLADPEQTSQEETKQEEGEM